MFDSFKAGVQIWLVEWGVGHSPWGVTDMNEAGGVPYTSHAGFGPSRNGLDKTVQTKQRLVGSDLLST